MKKVIFLGLISISLLTLSACGDKVKESKISESKNSSELTVSSEKNEVKKVDGDFVKTAADAYFDGEMLKGNTYSIKITDYKIIAPGEKGNDYGDNPVIAFWYDVMVAEDYDNSNPINPSTAWIMNFEAVQDNDPNAITKLNVGMLPDENHLDSQSSEIKPGGTVSNSIAYELTDNETPVELSAVTLMGDKLGSAEFKVK